MGKLEELVPVAQPVPAPVASAPLPPSPPLGVPAPGPKVAATTPTRVTKTSGGRSSTPVNWRPRMQGGKQRWCALVHCVSERHHGWMPIGVIANPAPADFSCGDATFFGWGGNYGGVYVAGAYKGGLGGWTTWRSGDRADLELDCGAGTLTMRHQRLGKTFTLTGLPTAAGTTWYAHANLVHVGDSVEFLRQ